MSIKKVKNYIAYADILRIAAAFSVVLLHTAGARLISVPIGSAQFLWATFFDTATRWSVPLFIMLSGMLFLNKKKKINIKTLYTKNIWRMVTAFVFWSYIYNYYSAFAQTRSLIASILIALKKMPHGAMHLWFVFVIIGLYIVLPFIKRMTDSMTKAEAEYFILLSILLTFLPKTLSSFEVLKPFIDYITKFEINMATGYIGLFVAGWYIDNFEHTKAFRTMVYIAGFIGFVYMFTATVCFSVQRGAVADEFMSFKSLSSFLMAFAVMMLAKTMFAKKSFKRRTQSDLSFYSKYTFGIYLIHEMFLNISSAKGWFVLSGIPFIGIPFEAVIIFTISGIIIGIISCMPFGKYIS